MALVVVVAIYSLDFALLCPNQGDVCLFLPAAADVYKDLRGGSPGHAVLQSSQKPTHWQTTLSRFRSFPNSLQCGKTQMQRRAFAQPLCIYRIKRMLLEFCMQKILANATLA